MARYNFIFLLTLIFHFSPQPIYTGNSASIRMLCTNATYTSAMQEDTTSLQALCTLGATLDEHDACGEAAIHHLTRKGDHQAVIILLRLGCPVDTPTSEGYTPMHIAATYGYTAIVQTLLDNGASIEGNTHRMIQTPLHIAVRNGHRVSF